MTASELETQLRRNIEIARSYPSWADRKLLGSRAPTIDWDEWPQSRLLVRRVEARTTFAAALKLLEDAGISYAAEPLLRVLLEHLAQVVWILYSEPGDTRTPAQRSVCLEYGMARQQLYQWDQRPDEMRRAEDGVEVHRYHTAMAELHRQCPRAGCTGKGYRIELPKGVLPPTFDALWRHTSSASHGFSPSRLVRIEDGITYVGEPAPLSFRFMTFGWVVVVYLRIVREIATVENPVVVGELDHMSDELTRGFMTHLLDAVHGPDVPVV